MNFWSEPEPWMILAAGLLCGTVAWIVYPYPLWAVNAAIASIAVGTLVTMRVIHWWEFEE